QRRIPGSLKSRHSEPQAQNLRICLSHIVATPSTHLHLSPMDSQALWLTLRLALSTTAVLLALALPLAWWITRGSGPARSLTQAIVALPLVLPPTVLGYYLLVALGPMTS